MVACSTFAVYVLLGNELDVATALTSLALFELLRFPLYMLPNVINNLVEAKVSVDRVQSFLLESEYQPVRTCICRLPPSPSPSPFARSSRSSLAGCTRNSSLLSRACSPVAIP